MAKLILNKVLRPMIFQFRIVGLWPSETNSIAYKTYGYFLFIAFSSVLTVTMLTEMVFAGLTASENFTDSMYMSLTEFALFIKIIRFKMRNRSIQRLLENVKNFHLETDDEVNLFNRKLYFIYIILIVNYTMTSVSFWSAFVKCIMSEEVILVFPAHYPIDWQNGGRMFWIVLAHQTTGMVITSNLNAGIDMYPDFLLHICTAQMEVLGKRLQALGYNHDKFKQRHQFNTADGQQKDTLQRLKDCIRLHQQILDLVDGVGRDFGISLFGQICVSAMVICALTIQMARPTDIVHITAYFLLLTSIGFQIFLPCYLGNEITFKSMELSSDVYSSNWIEMKVMHKKIILIFMERLKRSSSIVVGRLFLLSLQTFSSIITLAYRLLAILKNS